MNIVGHVLSVVILLLFDHINIVYFYCLLNVKTTKSRCNLFILLKNSDF